MSRKTKVVALSTEVLPSARSPVIPDVRAMLEKLVEEKIAELTAGNPDAAFEPFFRPEEIAREIRRYQTVPERRKWALYYEQWGCLICGTKDRPHGSLGMCVACRVRTHQRLAAILKSADGRNNREEVSHARDLTEVARAALLPPVAEIPPEKRLDLEGVAREALRPAAKALPARRKK